jgi:hypothetical protein
VRLHVFVTYALDKDGQLHATPAFTPEEKAPNSHYIGPRIRLDIREKRNICCTSPELNHESPVVQPVAQLGPSSRYTKKRNMQCRFAEVLLNQDASSPMCLAAPYSSRFQFFRTSFLARNREHLSTPSFPLSIFTSGRHTSAIRRMKKVVKLKRRTTYVLESVSHVRGRHLPSQICAQVCGMGPQG